MPPLLKFLLGSAAFGLAAGILLAPASVFVMNRLVRRRMRRIVRGIGREAILSAIEQQRNAPEGVPLPAPLHALQAMG